jgi:glycoside/pentoside/hexuronide:cation symporter, GPH family
VTLPVVGHLSDHLRSRWGRRHPFMYAAALPVAASYSLLWSPPAGWGARTLLVWFVAIAVLVRIYIAVYEIPSAALVPELTDHYDERASILSWRFLFGWWGGLTMAVLAYAVFLQPDAEHPVGVLNPAGYRRYRVVAALVMLAAVLVSAVGTHQFIPRLRPPPARRSPRHLPRARRDALQPLLPRALRRGDLRRWRRASPRHPRST